MRCGGQAALRKLLNKPRHDKSKRGLQAAANNSGADEGEKASPPPNLQSEGSVQCLATLCPLPLLVRLPPCANPLVIHVADDTGGRGFRP